MSTAAQYRSAARVIDETVEEMLPIGLPLDMARQMRSTARWLRLEAAKAENNQPAAKVVLGCRATGQCVGAEANGASG